jgi:hypothetical protein
MPLFKKKPVVIEAHLLTPETQPEIAQWCKGESTNEGILIKTLEGNMLASPNDYIIKGVNGEFYPCKPDIFLKTYEPASFVDIPKIDRESAS